MNQGNRSIHARKTGPGRIAFAAAIMQFGMAAVAGQNVHGAPKINGTQRLKRRGAGAYARGLRNWCNSKPSKGRI